MIRVRVLGEVDLQIGHRRVGMNTETLFALAFFLVMRAGEPIPRDELLTTLWDQGEDEQRRHALRQLLYRLRQKGLDLAEDGERVLLSSERVDCDFRSALDPKWPDRATAAEIDAAAAFGPSFSKRMASGYLQWLDGRLNALAEQHRKASLGQIALARREGRWADLERWAQSVLRTDPLNEEATLARAESAAMGGSKVMAMEILDNYLAEVWEISPELGKPAQALRKRLAERRPDWSYRGPREVPLVGRTELMSRLTTLVDAAWKGDGGAVVLVGAPGIGKTRLAMETRAYAELKGMRTVVVRAEAGNSELPFATLLALVPILVELPGAPGSSPESFDLLRHLATRQQRSVESVELMRDSLRDATLGAIQDVLLAVATECRLLFVVDDMHHLDGASRLALTALVKRTRGRRVSWIGTSRETSTARRVLDVADSGMSVYRLLPLDPSETRQLVESVLTAHRSTLALPDVEQVVATSGGNPLFARELGAHRAASKKPGSLPQTLRDLMRDRSGRMDEAETRLVRIVALLDGSSSVGLVRQLSGYEPSAFASELESLEAEGLLALTDGRLTLHESWRLHMLASMTPGVRAALSLECGEALARRDMDVEYGDKWRAAELFLAAGESDAAARLFTRTADEMLNRGLPDEAVVALERAITASTRKELRLPLTRRLAEAHHARGDLEGVVAATEELNEWALDKLEPQLACDVVVSTCHRADALAKLHRALVLELEALRGACSERRLPQEARDFAAYTGIRRALFAERRELAREFAAVVSSTGQVPSSLAGGLVALIYAAEFGTQADVISADAFLDDLSSETASATLKANSLRFRSHALRMCGALERARLVGSEAFEFASRYRLREIAANVAESMTFLELDCESLDAADTWLQRWREASFGRVHPMRDKGLRHAESRLLLQREAAEEVFNRLLPSFSELRADPVLSRRAGELATIALAAAGCQQTQTAREIALEVSHWIRAAAPEFLLDYPAEACVRALSASGEHAEAVSLAADYMTRRVGERATQLPPFFVNLRAAQRQTT